MATLLFVVATPVALYAVGVLALVAAGRRTDATALARLVPDCAGLVRRLLHDPRVPRRSRVALALLLAYLMLPVDLVPDFIPVAGHLDDALLIALTLRHLLRTAGPEALREHWRGPPASLSALLRLTRVAA